MTVWVAECGIYEDRYIQGIYATAEAAMAANPVRSELAADFVGDMRSGDLRRGGGWRQRSDGSWSNGLDWQEYCEVSSWEVQE